MKTKKKHAFFKFLRLFVSKKAIRFLFSVVLTVVLMWLMLSKVNIRDVFSVLLKTNIFFLFICIAFYITIMVVRTWRFNVLLNHEIGFKKLFSITLFHNFTNNIMPFRIGELSYIYLVKKANKRYSHGLASLIISRIFDLIALAFVLTAAMILSKTTLFSPYVLIGFIIALLLLALVLVFWNNLIFTPLIMSSKLMSKVNKKISDRVVGFLDELINAFSEIKSKKIIFETILSSLAITLISMLFTFYLVLSVGYYLPIHVLIIGATAAILTTILPVYGLGGYGTVEAAWTIVLTSFGYSAEMAIILSLSIHTIQLVFSAILGFLGWLGIRK